MKKLALHWQILIGMVLGVLFGLGMTKWDNLATPDIHEGAQFVADWIQPIGKIFVNLLKLIAIPLIIASLIKGISDLGDISKFSQIGGRTIGIYIVTTVIAVSIGLGIVNIVKPWSGISEATLTKLVEANKKDKSASEKVAKKIEAANKQKEEGPLSFIVSMVPDNFFKASADNRNMLQVIFFTLFFGISLLLVDKEKSATIKDFFDGLNEVVLKMVDLIMLIAPVAVFALLAQVIVSAGDPDILYALLKYAGTVVFGLLIMIGFYMVLISFFTGRSPIAFLKAMAPAQLLAFSTSSSAATLPVTMEVVEEHLGVEKEVTSFVCPVGATVNMDGTSLYQAVAAVFICFALDYPLTFSAQLTIVATATLASIGSAAVPGAGMVMLVIVLEAVGLPSEKLAIGLALIFAVDRPLDMCRTIVNVTGDATVAMLVGKSVGKLGDPKIKNWDDNYDKVK
ncbi:MAG TPA: dicarboxylate/amino acid:cation symporter [Phaeodactylibacter sp.]|nr:dicarboxylate/amino acid:cation symporter [Phaeodactylibacter sp.]